MDRIKKAYEELKSSAIDEAYSITIVFFRQEQLEDVKAKLMIMNEHENYTNGCSKQFMSFPWVWLPRTIALVQQVNERGVVLKLGEVAFMAEDIRCEEFSVNTIY